MPATSSHKTPEMKIEDFPNGYPRYSALISSHSSFYICRRFSRLRARLLLHKQDRLAVLEKELEAIDRDEPINLFLGKMRGEGNPSREAKLSRIDECLTDYDDFVERTRRVISIESVRSRNVESLRNWIAGSGSIARDESSYLMHERDLMSLDFIKDHARHRLETYVEERILHWMPNFGKKVYQQSSKDPNVYIYTGLFIHRVAKALLLSLITLLMMAPVVLCNIINDASMKIMIIILCTVLYLIILLELTGSKTLELILAAATYVTVLTVFVSNTGTT